MKSRWSKYERSYYAASDPKKTKTAARFYMFEPIMIIKKVEKHQLDFMLFEPIIFIQKVEKHQWILCCLSLSRE
jgi:hypothetical protein